MAEPEIGARARRARHLVAVVTACAAAFACRSAPPPARDGALPVGPGPAAPVGTEADAATPSPGPTPPVPSEDAEGSPATDRPRPATWWPVPSPAAIGRPLAEFVGMVPPGPDCTTVARRTETVVRCRREVAGQPVDALLRSGRLGGVERFELHLVTDPSPVSGTGRSLSTEEVLAWASAVEASAGPVLGPALPDAPAGESAPGGDVSRRSLRWRAAGAGIAASLDIVISPGLRMAVFGMGVAEASGPAAGGAP